MSERTKGTWKTYRDRTGRVSKVEAGSARICTFHPSDPNGDANAEFIVRAVNCHEEMLAMLDECRLDLSAYRHNAAIAFARGDHLWEGVPELMERTIAAIDALIAKAGGDQ